MASKILAPLLFISLIFCSQIAAASQILDVQSKIPKERNVPKLDLCTFCFEEMENMLEAIIDVIANDDVIGTCEELCGQLPNEIEQYACTIICAYVGIELFVEVIQYEDPDPIFICQEFDMCPVVNGGEIVINKTSVVPPAGKVGTTFDLSMIYDVINATGPGYIAVAIQGPDDSYPITSGVFTEGQNPGIYSARWQVQAEPSETEDFAPGYYKVTFYICEGDCTKNHKWGGLYAEAFNNFNVTA